MTIPTNLAANLAGVIGCSFTGASIVATRFVIGETDPVSLAFLRYLIGALCLAPFAFYLMRGKPRLTGREWLAVFGLGLLFFGLFPWLFNLSLSYTSAARGALGLATAPLLTLALASVLRSEPFTGVKLVAVIAAFGGVGVAMASGPGGLAGEGRFWVGDLIMLAAAAIAAVYAVFAKPLLMRHPAIVITAMTMASGVIGLAPVAGAEGLFDGAPSFTTGGWIALAFLGIGGGAIQFGLWVWAVSRLTPTQGAIFLTLTPITAVLLAALVLGEAIYPGLLVGLGLVIAGILLANRPANRA